ncbi:flagellar hook-associated protein FlgK [candidate division KSB1 bacterium]|nr:flagellar hook-associated protein FlgK [candidate division KSB1 bacterium]
MSTLSDILQTGRSAMAINQLAMQVIGNNAANVNTEGYSRRRLDLAAMAPSSLGDRWQVGNGVDIQYLGRVRDRLIDQQIRQGTSEESYWTRKDDMLGRVEEVFNELGGAAISDQLQQFWSAWQDLANDPESESSRIALREKSETLAANVRRVYGNLRGRQNDVDQEIESSVARINNLTSRVAALNIQILHAENSGVEASDLRDSRDIALEELSGLISIRSEEGADGIVNVYTNGRIIVQRDTSIDLVSTRVDSASGSRTVISAGIHARPFVPEGGELKALIDLRDEDIEGTIRALNDFARELTSQVNAIHTTGYGLDGSSGQEYFSPHADNAGEFTLSAMIQADVSYIAAASALDSPGDNSLALRIAGLQTQKLLNNGRSTLDEYFTSSVLAVGSKREFAAGQLAAQQGAMESLRNRRQQVSGVSLDEEMTHLIEVQNAYEAAAKIVKTVDEMLQTVLDIGA